MYIFDRKKIDFSFEEFIPETPELDRSDDLVITRDTSKAYSACHCGTQNRSHVTVVDIPSRTIKKVIPTGVGSCGLTMTNDERHVVVSNDQDDSISVIDTLTDEVVNTPCARAGFEALGIKGYIQGITCGQDDSIYVYGCSGNGAIVRFFDVAHSCRYRISFPGGKYDSPRA